MGGFYAIAKAMPIEHVYDDGIAVDNNMYKTYEKWIEKNKIQRTTLRSGDVVDFGHGAVFVVYAPWVEPLTDKKGETDLNNNSIAIYRTDTMGRIHISTDGNEWQITTER